MSLFIVLLIALIIPIIMDSLHLNNIPTSIAEIIAGILLGKSLFNLITINSTLSQLSTLGVIILIFLSGMEIDFSLFKKENNTQKNAPLKVAILSFTSILILSLIFSIIINKFHLFNSVILGTILFSTIALGIIITALKEKEILSNQFGQILLLIAAFGEIVPLLGLTVYAIAIQGHIQKIWLIALIFILALGLLLHFRPIYNFFEKINKVTTQLDIRLAFFIVITLVAFAEHVGAENILGAFLAGIVMKLLKPKEETLDKLSSLGYGFFIPIFFITTGAKINLKLLLTNPKSLTLIPIFLIGFVLAKIALILTLKKTTNYKNILAGSILEMTTITLVIPILSVAQELNIINATQSGAITVAAILTCLICPIIFNNLYTKDPIIINNPTVHFIGVNEFTVPVAQQLSSKLYKTALYTNSKKYFEAFHHKANIQLILDTNEPYDNLINSNDVFNTDILIISTTDHKQNYNLTKYAMNQNVKRIITRINTKTITQGQYDELKKNNIEIFNPINANINLFRNIIETPDMLHMLNDIKDMIFEIKIQNRKFCGKEIKNLPLIDQITIIQIYHDKKLILPHGDTQLHFNDHIIFTAPKNIIPKIRDIYETQN